MPDQTRNLNSVPDFSGTLDSNDRLIMTDNKASLKALTTAILGKAIVEGYTGSSLAGARQSVKSAIDALNSKTNDLNMISTETITDTIKTHVSNGRNFGNFIADKSLSDIPDSSKDFIVVFYKQKGSNNVYVNAIANTDATIQYVGRIYNYTDSAATLANGWIRQPTRAEVDALNSNFAGSISRTVNSWTDAIEAAKNANYRTVQIIISGADITNLPTGNNMHWGTIYCNPGGTYGGAMLSSFTGVLYTRGLTGGTWTSWKQVSAS